MCVPPLDRLLAAMPGPALVSKLSWPWGPPASPRRTAALTTKTLSAAPASSLGRHIGRRVALAPLTRVRRASAGKASSAVKVGSASVGNPETTVRLWTS